jgi:hypothetical protein
MLPQYSKITTPVKQKTPFLKGFFRNVYIIISQNTGAFQLKPCYEKRWLHRRPLQIYPVIYQ